VIGGVHGGCAAVNRGADYVSTLPRRYAPEQGAGPDTVNRTIKLRLLARPPAPVSTAIRRYATAGKLYKNRDNFSR